MAPSARADFDDFAGADRGDRGENFRNERLQSIHGLTNARDHDDRDPDRPDILLMTDALIRTDEDLESVIDCGSQQNAVSETAPPLLTDGRNVVIRQKRRKLHR